MAHEKGCPLSAQAFVTQTEKGKAIKIYQIYRNKDWKQKHHFCRKNCAFPQGSGSGGGGAAIIKSQRV